MLVIACINYMNLATARSANRAKEVGIRKVMGSQRSQLILQFISESVVLALFSLFPEPDSHLRIVAGLQWSCE